MNKEEPNRTIQDADGEWFETGKPKQHPPAKVTVTVHYNYRDGKCETFNMMEQSMIKMICLVRDVLNSDNYLESATLRMLWKGTAQSITILRDV